MYMCVRFVFCRKMLFMYLVYIRFSLVSTQVLCVRWNAIRMNMYDFSIYLRFVTWQHQNLTGKSLGSSCWLSIEMYYKRLEVSSPFLLLPSIGVAGTGGSSVCGALPRTTEVNVGSFDLKEMDKRWMESGEDLPLPAESDPRRVSSLTGASSSLLMVRRAATSSTSSGSYQMLPSQLTFAVTLGVVCTTWLTSATVFEITTL